MSLVKAQLIPEQGEPITCLFNPAEITVAKSNTWQAGEAKGTNAPKLRFQGGQSATLSLTLMLDTTADGSDVTVHTTKLLGLMQVNQSVPGADAQRNSARPPWVKFSWGTLNSFKAVVERLSLRYTYFSSDGVPLRAKADIGLKQFDDEEFLPLQNPTSHASSLHTVHTVVTGDTIDRISARYYRDATRWRLIADANAIVDPLALPVGSAIVIPDLPVRSRA